MDINESPVYVLLNPLINHAQKDLPVTIFESGMQLIVPFVRNVRMYVYDKTWNS